MLSNKDEGGSTQTAVSICDINIATQQNGESIREKLEIRTGTIVLDGFGITDHVDPIHVTVEPGEILYIIGPNRVSSMKKISPLLFAISGRNGLVNLSSNQLTGRALGLVSGEGTYDLTRSKLPLLSTRSTLYRKATPLESIVTALRMDGHCRNRKEIGEVLMMLQKEFPEEAKEDFIFSNRINVGDGEVHEGEVKYIKNACCQLMDQLNSLNRRKLEFMCRFIQSCRIDSSVVFESKGLDEVELYQFACFLRRICKTSSKSSTIFHSKRVDAKLLDVADKVLVLAEGKVVYCGSRSNFSDFVRSSTPDPLPPDHSVSGFFLDQVNQTLHKDVKLEEFQAQFKESEISSNLIATVQDLADKVNDGRNVTQHGFVDNREWFKQFIVVFQRTTQNYARTAALTSLRILLYVVCPVIAAVVSTINTDDASERAYILIAIFDFTIAATLFGLFAFRLERKTLFMECSANRVFLTAWIGGHFTASALMTFISAILPAILTFFLLSWNVNHPGAASFFRFLVNFWLVLLVCESLWVMVAFLIPQKKKGTLIASFFGLAIVLGQGVFTKIEQLPASRYLLFVTLFRPLMNSFFAAEYTSSDPVYQITLHWSEEGRCVVDRQNFTQTWNNENVLSCLSVSQLARKCPVVPKAGTLWTGEEVLECLKYKPNSSAAMIGVTCAIIFAIKLLTYAGLRYQIRHMD